MPIPFLNDIDLSGVLKILNSTGYLDLDKNEIRNAVVQNLASEPASPLAGQIIHNTAKTDSVKGNGKFGYKAATSWVYPDMEKSVYDTNNDGRVNLADDSDTLDGQHGSYYLNRANHTGTDTSASISDFTEASQDAVGNALIDTNSIDFTYDDTNNQIKADLKLNGTDLRIQATGVDLNPTGVSAGTYTKLTIDTKGRVTAATVLLSSDLPSHNHTSTDITDFHTAVRTNRLDQMAVPTASLNLNSQKITNLADPTNPQDAATKNYVDSAVAGFDWKNSVKACSTANLTLSGTQTVDGVALVAGDRILVKDQTTPSQNGIYVVAASTWSRATDADAWNEIVSAAVFIEQGTVNGDTAWVCTSDQGGTLGTTAIVFSQFTGAALIIAGNGLSKTGNQIDVNVDNQSIEISADTLQAKLDSTGGITKSASGLKINVDNTTLQINGSNQIELKGAYKNKKVLGTITGDNTTTTFSITHNLANKDIFIDVYENTTGYTAYPLIERFDTNTAKFTFKVAPTTGKVYNVVIIG
jgi:phage-related tail fiber protein